MDVIDLSDLSTLSCDPLEKPGTDPDDPEDSPDSNEPSALVSSRMKKRHSPLQLPTAWTIGTANVQRKDNTRTERGLFAALCKERNLHCVSLQDIKKHE